MTTQVSEKIAKVLSVIMYPLLIPTYGMILFYIGFTLQMFPLPTHYWMVLIFGTLFFTGLLPLSLILIMIKRGHIKDIYITEPNERTMPYVYTSMGFAFWTYFLYAVCQAPTFIVLVALGATVAIGLVALINLKWKVSAHLTALGGLLGGVCSFCLYCSTLPQWLIILLLVINFVAMCARLKLNAHTPLQLVAGFLLGLLCTFIPDWILYHV